MTAGDRSDDRGDESFGCPSSAPAGLAAVRFRTGADEFVLLSYPVERRLPENLTAAERDVVAAVLAGDTTAEIARRRGASPRTVANQLQRVYRKLGVASRAELAVLVQGGVRSSS